MEVAETQAGGTLYVVATPIGNLADGSQRAREVLAKVAVIAAEDTRHSRSLLDAWGIQGSLISLHEHNEVSRVERLIKRLQNGDDVALISDAGTPLVADPGYRLVRAAQEAGLCVRPVPGPCAMIAGLSVSGLATDRVLFLGFLPSRAAARRSRLQSLCSEPSTLVCYESPRRLVALLQDVAAELGAGRQVWLGRELTKRFETHYRGEAAALAERLPQLHPDGMRGECVVVIEGASTAPSASAIDPLQLLRVLLEELPASRAARVAARLTGRPRQELYREALALQQ